MKKIICKTYILKEYIKRKKQGLIDGFNLIKIFLNEKKINMIQKAAIFLLILLSIYIVVVYKNISLVVLMSYIFLINVTEYKTTKGYNKRHSKQL